jgi:hypothetical protein
MAFEKIPFYDSVGDTIFRSSGSITCLEAWGDKLFVGTQGGYLMQYLIEPPIDFSPSSFSASSSIPSVSSPSLVGSSFFSFFLSFLTPNLILL